MKAITLIPLLFALASCGREGENAGPPAGQAFPVQVASPKMQDIQLTRTYTGRFVPVDRVDLRARVSGYISEIHFTEGQPVQKGDPLVTIDPALFDAELAAAEARVAQARASLTLAEQNAVRADELIKRRGISREDYDARKAAVTQAEADLGLAIAQRDRAKLNRSYADIEAPISGIIGRREVTLGNYITGGMPGAPILTTIIPHSPIYCEFEIDERQVLQFTRLYFEGRAEGREGRPAQVEIAVSDQDDFEFTGDLVFGDNELDVSTASLQLRAIVANKDKFLTPGLFARVRVPVSTEGEKMVVPETALGFDQARRFVWLVTPEDIAQRRYVEVGELVGDKRIITGGLELTDRIAVSGVLLLRPGTPVQPLPSEPAKGE